MGNLYEKAKAKLEALKAEKRSTFTVVKVSTDGKRLQVKSSKGVTKEWGTQWLTDQLEEGNMEELPDGRFQFVGTIETEWE